MAKISKHTNEPWAAWLDENGDAALAALAEEPLATALSTWRRHRQTESSDPIPFYVNRSKKTLDKASAFCGKLASRLTQLSRGSIAAKLDGWQLEILCRVQMPQDELHVCLKLSDRPEVVAAARARLRGLLISQKTRYSLLARPLVGALPISLLLRIVILRKGHSLRCYFQGVRKALGGVVRRASDNRRGMEGLGSVNRGYRRKHIAAQVFSRWEPED